MCFQSEITGFEKVRADSTVYKSEQAEVEDYRWKGRGDEGIKRRRFKLWAGGGSRESG